VKPLPETLGRSLPFVESLRAAGGRVYLVGGPVRDLLLSRPVRDLDLLVAGLPPDTLEKLLAPFGSVNEVGKSFGIIKLSTGREVIDFALPRKERSTGPGHKDFWVHADPFLPVEEDLGRRDFTVNAFACELLDGGGRLGSLIDVHGGAKDLDRRELRLLHDRSFQDDPLRLIRAAQFAARLGFTIEASTMELMKRDAPLARHLPAERISTEIDKFLGCERPGQGFDWLERGGLIPEVLPELKSHWDEKIPAQFLSRGRCIKGWMSFTPRLEGRPSLLRWGVLAACISPGPELIADAGGKAAAAFLKRIRASVAGADPDRLAGWTRALKAAETWPGAGEKSGAPVRRWMSLAGRNELPELLELVAARAEAVLPYEDANAGDEGNRASPLGERWVRRVRAEMERNVPLSVQDLAVKGEDLKAAGVEAGPRLGQILKALLAEVLDDPDRNRRDYLLSRAASL